MTATETVTTNPPSARKRIGPADLIDADKPADLAGLVAVAKALVAHDKGLLAMDESIHTCNERFAAIGIPQSEPARRDYRDLLVSTPGLAESISGAILYDETIRQHTTGGVPFAQALAEATGRPWKQRNGNRDLPWTAYSLGRTETGRGPDRGRTVVT